MENEKDQHDREVAEVVKAIRYAHKRVMSFEPNEDILNLSIWFYRATQTMDSTQKIVCNECIRGTPHRLWCITGIIGEARDIFLNERDKV